MNELLAESLRALSAEAEAEAAKVIGPALALAYWQGVRRTVQGIADNPDLPAAMRNLFRQDAADLHEVDLFAQTVKGDTGRFIEMARTVAAGITAARVARFARIEPPAPVQKQMLKAVFQPAYVVPYQNNAKAIAAHCHLYGGDCGRIEMVAGMGNPRLMLVPRVGLCGVCRYATCPHEAELGDVAVGKDEAGRLLYVRSLRQLPAADLAEMRHEDAAALAAVNQVAQGGE